MKPIQIASTPLRSTLWLLLFSLAAPAASLVNNFTTPYDYVNNGIIGETNWDGIYMNLGDIPNNNNAGGNGAGATTVANSAVTYPGYLGLQSLGTDWAGGDNDGLFVWKLPGVLPITSRPSCTVVVTRFSRLSSACTTTD